MMMSELTHNEASQLRAIHRRDGMRRHDAVAETKLLDLRLIKPVSGGYILTTKGEMLIAFGRV